jgi:cellulose biosynthesis protein BcsQ
MKLRVAIVGGGSYYQEHLSNTVGNHYSDQLELYLFSDIEKAYDTLQSRKIDLFLVDEQIQLNETRVPKGCPVAYLTESTDTSGIKDKPAISKYQRISSFNRQLLRLYADSDIDQRVFGGGGADRLVCFTSPMGGAGVTVMAAAYAIEAAAAGKKTLYLDLSRFGDSGVFFHQGDSDNFSEIIYALKNQQSNLILKINSTVQQDQESKVFFFAPTKVALDNEELTTEDILKLIQTLQTMGDYQNLVIDIDFGLDDMTVGVLDLATTIVMVANGCDTGNSKLERALNALKIKDQDGSLRAMDRVILQENRCMGGTARIANTWELKTLKEFQEYRNFSAKQVIRQLVEQKHFQDLI